MVSRSPKKRAAVCRKRTSSAPTTRVSRGRRALELTTLAANRTSLRYAEANAAPSRTYLLQGNTNYILLYHLLDLFRDVRVHFKAFNIVAAS